MYVYALVLMAKDAKNYQLIEVWSDRVALGDYCDSLNLNQLGMIYAIKTVFMR